MMKKIKRKRILKDIKKAKKIYEMRMTDYMCNSFKEIGIKYCNKPISSIIPEFNVAKRIYYSIS